MSGRLRPRPGSVKRQAGTKIIAVQDDPAAPHRSPVYRGFATMGRHADCRDEPPPNPPAARIGTNRAGIFFTIPGRIRIGVTIPGRPRLLSGSGVGHGRRRSCPRASARASPCRPAPAGVEDDELEPGGYPQRRRRERRVRARRSTPEPPWRLPAA
ncbi:hypothetical protein SI859A1_01981 [Aurantimonas manganoxydans SI85-9A1]|uniref:Uncharacterized protein n=1 Tax=Aurantimonas manganoxydans (strain ATCC BAA-1229 / DSM 21871 / SI85-9A1) TaxID=287752 RepID=Q1YN62_AURMS|nr:hypothetical protein SI859A1_01981 [Aurantimonas manganoxydans SI85-9A1]